MEEKNYLSKKEFEEINPFYLYTKEKTDRSFSIEDIVDSFKIETPWGIQNAYILKYIKEIDFFEAFIGTLYGQGPWEGTYFIPEKYLQERLENAVTWIFTPYA
jgi:hypothetical protein